MHVYILCICIHLPANYNLAPSISQSMESYTFTLKSSFCKNRYMQGSRAFGCLLTPLGQKKLPKYQF